MDEARYAPLEQAITTSTAATGRLSVLDLAVALYREGFEAGIGREMPDHLTMKVCELGLLCVQTHIEAFGITAEDLERLIGTYTPTDRKEGNRD